MAGTSVEELGFARLATFHVSRVYIYCDLARDRYWISLSQNSSANPYLSLQPFRLCARIYCESPDLFYPNPSGRGEAHGLPEQTLNFFP
jgi:hypothetical protein